MPSVPHILVMRRRRAGQAHKNPASRLGWMLAGGISLLAAAATIAGAIYYSNLTRDLPPLGSVAALVEAPESPLRQPTRLYDRSGEHLLFTLENPAASGRSYLYVEAGAEGSERPESEFFSPSLVTATLAASDPDFLPGTAYPWLDLLPVTKPSLAQTLVSKLLFESEPRGLRRELRERLLAAQLISAYGREKVLEWYLNSAAYGSLAYGADAAARVYFDKPASGLSLSEAALLAATAQDPASNPLDSPEAAFQRGQDILKNMFALGWITPAQARQAGDDMPVIQPARPDSSNLAPAYTSLVLAQLENLLGRERLEQGGLIVQTSLDIELQAQVQCAVDAHLARLADPAGPGLLPTGCPAASLLPSVVSAPGEGLELAANVVVLDPTSGEILALVGNPPQMAGLLARRPAGTLLTPFVYLTAFTRGMGPASLVWDIPAGQPAPEVENLDGSFHGPMRLRLALANDYLVPTLEVYSQVGPGNVWRTAAQMGLPGLEGSGSESGVEQDPLSAFIQEPANLLELSRAYAIIANQGAQPEIRLEAYSGDRLEASPLAGALLHSVRTNQGNTLLKASAPQPRPVLTPGLAYLLTHILSDESARWPSLGHPNALDIGRPAAAKLGQTLQGQDAWTLGYTPQRVVGVWVGARDAQPASEAGQMEVPASAAAALWHAVIQTASKDQPPLDWNMPAGVSSLAVCDPSGLLPTRDCPAVVNEVFLAGNEPASFDSLYQLVPINRVSGHLATLFTPADEVEERVYLILPPEAGEWTQQSGLPTPPETYDLIPAEPQSSPGVEIASPAMFAYLRGKVQIKGWAAGLDFSFYRVQVGQGMNPRQWLQVGSDSDQAVSNGVLAEWDTRGLNGLYAIQLLVVNEDQRVSRSTVMVSVDNTAPVIEVLYPQPGGSIRPETRTITLRAQAEDDLALETVEFFLDGKPLHTFLQPPYAAEWAAKPGEHNLRVLAVDAAGNTAETEITFTVEE